MRRSDTVERVLLPRPVQGERIRGPSLAFDGVSGRDLNRLGFLVERRTDEQFPLDQFQLWHTSCLAAPPVPTDDYVDRVRERLPTGDLLDVAFDKLLPLGARAKSGIHWSPLSVARSAALRFGASGARRVLDVGCGPGKFCIGAAFARAELELHGVDRSADLVRIAAELAGRLALGNVSFTAGDALELPWSAFDGFYFFNPFAQDNFGSRRSLNESTDALEVELGSELLLVARLLSTARMGATIVTYHGLGGPIPSSYDLVSEEPCGSGCLRTWVKTRARELAFYHLDRADDVSRVPRSYLERKFGLPAVTQSPRRVKTPRGA